MYKVMTMPIKGYDHLIHMNSDEDGRWFINTKRGVTRVFPISHQAQEKQHEGFDGFTLPSNWTLVCRVVP